MPTFTTLPNEILREIVQYINNAHNIKNHDLTIFSLLYVNKQFRDIAIDVYTKEGYGDLSGPIKYGGHRVKEMYFSEIMAMVNVVTEEVWLHCPSVLSSESAFVNAPFRLACMADNMFPGRSWKYMRGIGRETQYWIAANVWCTPYRRLYV